MGFTSNDTNLHSCYIPQKGVNMKKSILVLSTALLATSAFADEWQRLPTSHAEPAPMGEQVQQTAPVARQYSTQPTHIQSKYGVAAGFAGSKLSDSADTSERFKGFFLNGSYDYSNLTTLWSEYSRQKASELAINEVSFGANYKLFEDQNSYFSAGIGLGWAWIDESYYDESVNAKASVELNYLTIPVNFESGVKLSQEFTGFLNLGYKWYSNRESEACLDNICATGSSSELDLDGVTYKVGLRYSF